MVELTTEEELTSSTDSDFADLLLRLSEGDQEAMGEVYDQYGGYVYSLAGRILSSQQEVEIVTREVFLSLWKKASNGQFKESSPLTFLGTATRNQCIEFLRRAGRRIPAAAEELTFRQPCNEEGSERDPFSQVELSNLSHQLRRCLGILPGPQRNIIKLTCFDCLTHFDIAERSSEAPGVVKSRLRLALDKLRSCLIYHLDEEE